MMCLRDRVGYWYNTISNGILSRNAGGGRGRGKYIKRDKPRKWTTWWHPKGI